MVARSRVPGDSSYTTVQMTLPPWLSGCVSTPLQLHCMLRMHVVCPNTFSARTSLMICISAPPIDESNKMHNRAVVSCLMLSAEGLKYKVAVC